MPEMPPRGDLPTHEVANQPPPGASRLWLDDAPLQAAVTAATDPGPVIAFAETLDAPEMRQAGHAANRHPPEMRQFDAGGRRLDEVDFHPAYHRLMQAGAEAGYAAIPWDGTPGGHVGPCRDGLSAWPGRTGRLLPADHDLCRCARRCAPTRRWPRNGCRELTARTYDPRLLPVSEKRAATLGMAMTEKQGGSDVRTNTTRAAPEGGHYRLTGHKWFCSAPMSDGFLTLAQAPGGLTCFLVPRWLDQGRNGIHLMRLKDKLGNRANASAEIEYHGALAHRLGEEGRGVRTIIEMVHHTRLDTAMAPAGLMRAALTEAYHWVQPPNRVPAQADRPAADAGGAGRSDARLSGRAGAGDARRPRLRRRLRGRPCLRPHRRGAGEIPQQQGLRAGHLRMRWRRWVAWDMSRTRACRCSTARLR